MFSKTISMNPAIMCDEIQRLKDGSVIIDTKINNIWKSNNILGAKNLWNNIGISRNNQDVASSVNTDGTVKVNGTASGQGQVFTYNYFSIPNVKVGDSLILSYEVLSGSYTHGSLTSDTRLYLVKNNEVYKSSAINLGASLSVGDKGSITYTLDASCFDENGVCLFDGIMLFVRTGDIFNNLILAIMLRLAEDINSNYAPYSMTNKELTDDINALKCKETTAGSYYLTATVDASGNITYSWEVIE